MRARPTFVPLAALFSLALVVAGCGGDDDSAPTTTTTTTTAAEAPPDDGDMVCFAYRTVVRFFASTEEIAASGNQDLVDQSLATNLEVLAPEAEGDDDLTEALETLGQVSFQVTDTETGPSESDIAAALDTIEDAWGEECGVEEEEEAEEGTEEPGASGGTVSECPAPEVLEAEGFSCDSEGNLVPLDEETDAECPAPEVLEAEGFTCDSEGNLTPIPDDGGGGQVEECPAPEVLEAEGYTCDSEGNLTPVE